MESYESAYQGKKESSYLGSVTGVSMEDIMDILGLKQRYGLVGSTS
jgi:hypothetical protein